MSTTATTTMETASTGRVLRPRPNTKSSIRSSLNLASVGKALAEVMHKEGKDTQGEKEKAAKKTKETSSRRSSLVPPGARTTTEKVAAGLTREKSSSPETRTITKNARRMSGLPKLSEIGTTSSEESSSSPVTISQKSTLVRSNTLRPRNSGAASGLPKYRPKSALIEATSTGKPPSPVRVGLRRKLSCSDEDKEDKGKPMLRLTTPTAVSKGNRAISPLPHRGALQVNLSAAINVRPATPEKKVKTPTPQSSPSRIRTSPVRASPTRVKKASKVAAPAPPVIESIPSRSSSSSSSSSSRIAASPTTPSAMQRFSLKASGEAKRPNAHKRSPLSSMFSSLQDSPLTDAVARRKAQSSSPTPSRTSSSLVTTPTPIILTEGSSLDSIDADDVEFMLSSIASPTAPTPSLPRISASLSNNEPDPETPTRRLVPGRQNTSYLSTTTGDDSPFLRPNRRMLSTNDRSSILSWEQFTAHNRSLDTEEVENMLSIDAPFNPGAVSPALTSLTELPESPSLSAMPSPTGYGSISQVLLPEVTPSPAPHNAALRFEEFAAETPPMFDSAAVTMLRLQVASLENTATERLMKIEFLESQLQSAKEARIHDAEELSKQMSELEQQVQASLRPDEQLTQQVAFLEEQLRHAQTGQEQAVQEALEKLEADESASRAKALRTKRVQCDATIATCTAGAAWSAVRDTAEGELELIRSNKEMLAVLLAGLDRAL